ncbi:hypothetical protein Tco_1474838 [Tanacetum coccineum]
MMHPGRLRRQLRKKLCWLKVGVPFLKTASVVTRGRKMAFGLRLWSTLRAKQNRKVVGPTEYRAQQEDMRLYLQPYEHLSGEQRLAMDAIRAQIKAKYNLQF